MIGPIKSKRSEKREREREKEIVDVQLLTHRDEITVLMVTRCQNKVELK